MNEGLRWTGRIRNWGHLRPSHHQLPTMLERVIRALAWCPLQTGVNRRCGPKCGPHQVGPRCHGTRKARLNWAPRRRINRRRPARAKRFNGHPRPCINCQRPTGIQRFNGHPRPRFSCMIRIRFVRRRGGKDTWPKRPRRHCQSQRVLWAMSSRILARSAANSSFDQGSSLRFRLERKHLLLPSLPCQPSHILTLCSFVVSSVD